MWGIEELCANAMEGVIDRVLAAGDGELALLEASQAALVVAGWEAKKWFAITAPPWAPRPLPVTACERRRLLAGPKLVDQLTAGYALSLRHFNFNYKRHPCLVEYARGMVCFAPAELQRKPAVERTISPMPLPGLNPRGIWRQPTAPVS